MTFLKRLPNELLALKKTGIIKPRSTKKKVKPMTNSTITAELLKQLDQLPMEFQKKVLEFARALNTATLKGKPGKDLLKFAGTIDQDSLKAMEEAVEYGCERVDTDERFEMDFQ
jgi:hypothetical protein